MSEDYFARLQLPQAILLEEESLKTAWHRAAAAASAKNAEEIHQAYAVLRTPGRRIGHLLDLHGKGRSSSQTRQNGEQPGAALFALFFEIGTLLRQADASIATIATLSSATSAVQRAALLDPLLTLGEALEQAQQRVRDREDAHLASLRKLEVDFPHLDEAQWKELTALGCDLVFLAKWTGELQKRQTQLQEMLLGAMN